MHVSNISSDMFRNKYFYQSKKREINCSNLKEGLSQVSPSYEYFVPFKASVSSKHLHNFEKLIDKLYERNSNCDIQKVISDIDFYCAGWNLSFSRLLNNKFEVISKDILNAPQDLMLSEHLITGATAQGLDKIRLRFKRIKEFSYSENFPLSADEVIKNMMNSGNLNQMDCLDKSEQSLGIRNAIIQELLEPLELPDVAKKVLKNDFIQGYQEYLRKSNYPVFNETKKDLLKEILKDEDFILYSQKMDKIEANDRRLGENYLNKTIDDIYEDLLKKNISPFENPKYYDYLSKNEEKVDLILENLLGFQTDLIMFKFDNSSIAKKHKVLLTNPMFIDKFDKFIEYVNTQNIDTEGLSPIELQNSFSEYLGTATVYCSAMVENPSGLIKDLQEKRGLYNILSFPKEDFVKKMKYYLDLNPEFSTIKSNLDYVSYGVKNEFIPVSSSIDNINLNIFSDSYNRKPVLIKMTVPKLNIIKQGGNSRDNREKMYIPFTLPSDNLEIINL